MKTVTGYSILVLAALLSLPTTSESFSRRSHSSEVSQSQPTTTPLKAATTETTETGGASAQAIPEPPALLLMSIALGLLAAGFTVTRFRKTS